jgi:hypothetical protein
VNWKPWRKAKPAPYDVLREARVTLAREEWQRETDAGETNMAFEDWALIEAIWQDVAERRP